MEAAPSKPPATAGLDVLTAGAKELGYELSTEQIDQFRRYLAGLVQWSGRANLTSRAALADAERVLFLDSLAVVPIVQREQPKAGRLIDVGSGAGFPGLVLKLLLPELHVVLLEATRKKAEFLRWMVGALGVERVEVLAERAEVAGRRAELRGTFDVATARALGPLPVVLELSLPFCKVGGTLIAPRGIGAAEEAEHAASVAGQLGGRIAGVETPSAGGLAERTAMVVIEKVRVTPERFPRHNGIPAKRPLS